MKLLFIGPQGSGKSTQAKIIAEKLGICYISTGDLFRQIAQEDSDLGLQVKELLNQGKLVGDDIVVELVKKKLLQPECQKGFITDGYPRTLVQHELFDPGFDQVFYLKISDETAQKRLLARGRADDSPKIIKERLNAYYQQTQPLLDYYQKLGSLVVIDGEKSIEDIEKEIEEKVKNGASNG